MQENIHLYYTNDLHSHFENWPKITAFLNKKKQEAARYEAYTLTVDIGDHMDRVNPISEATLGKANVTLLNEAEYDIVTLGNNEGITLGHDELYHLYDDASFDVVCANLKHTYGDRPPWLQNYQIRTTPNGTRIGLFGLTARFNPYYHLLGWDAKEIEKVVADVIVKMKQETDVIVLLSHLGINEDERIAHLFPEIDVIIGGHTHHLFKTGEKVKNTLLTAAGKLGAFAGEVILTWDHDKKELTNKEAYAIDVTHLEPDVKTLQLLDQLEQKSDEILQQTLIQTKKPLLVDWHKETKLIKDLTETLLEWTKADGAMLNAGLLLHTLEAGKISYKDIHAICPHPINPCIVTLSGEELTEVVRASLTDQFKDLELKGFGFRGKVLGRMVFSGLDVKINSHEAGQEYVEDILIDNAPIERKKVYRIATGDLFTFGSMLPEVSRSPVKQLFLPEFIRDLLQETLMQKRNP